MQNKVIGLVNLFTTPDLSPLTDNRPLGSTTFLGRYAFIDFPLSCLCNSNINEIGILVRDHQRSLLKHMGPMKDWVSNTKIGKQHIMFNEDAIGKPLLNTDINNIRENDWILYSSNATQIVIMPAHIIASIDLRPFVDEHIKNASELSIIGTEVANPSKDYVGEKILEVDDSGNVTGFKDNLGNSSKKAFMSMQIYIINRRMFGDLITKFANEFPGLSLQDLIIKLLENKRITIKSLRFEGFSCCFNSFKTYMNYSFKMADLNELQRLFFQSWPIYTVTHDTPPASYSRDAKVSSSFVSNGAVIEGTVINSIIGRNVKISKGAVVKNCVIFSGVSVGENATVNNALIDKYAIITRSHSVSGTESEPIYIKQGAFI